MPNMNKKFSSKDSQTDWERVTGLRDEDIDLSEIPEVTKNQITQAVLRVGGGPVSKGKVRVNILLDANIVAYFKAIAGGRGYQTLINEALKSNIQNQDIETLLRRVIREELKVLR